MSGETIKQYIADNLLRGSYITAEETPLESPLQFILWLADRQVNRPNNHKQVQLAANEEMG